MAFKTCRIQSSRRRPPGLASGMSSLIESHSSSVRSLGYNFSFMYPFYLTDEDFSDRLLASLVRRALPLQGPSSLGRSRYLVRKMAFTVDSLNCIRLEKRI